MSETETDKTETSWRDKTLKAAGYGYLVGDAAMAASGIIKGKAGKDIFRAGAIWAVGGIGAAAYGNPDTEKQLEIQAGKLEAYLKKHGITIPDDARAQSELLTSKTAWQKVTQFMYEHPSELLNGMYALGAAMLLHGAVKDELSKAGGKTVFPMAMSKAAFANVSSKFWIGALVGTGALTGLLVKEDPNARKRDENRGIITRAIDFIREQPLRTSAALYTVNNGFLALQSWQDYSARHTTFAASSVKPHYASTVQLAAYLFSNLMLSLSTRSQITKKGFATHDLAKLEHAAASIIAAQPPQMQRQVLVSVSEFMAKEKGINLPAEQIAQDLATRVTEITRERLQMAANGVKWEQKIAKQTEESRRR